jgi:hypothetical protein
MIIDNIIITYNNKMKFTFVLGLFLATSQALTISEEPDYAE